MKKWIAVILAVLLLGPTFAFAEAVPVLDLNDPVVDVTTDGESVHLELGGLTLRFGAVGEEGSEALVLNILGDGEVLFAAAARPEDGRVLLTADGLSHSYAAPLPGGQLVESADDADGGDGAPLAALLEGVMSAAEIEPAADGLRFRLPYTAVNRVLRELLPTIEQIPNADELIAALDEAEARGDGFELSGEIGLGKDTQLSLAVTAVEGGVAADEPAALAELSVSTVEDGADFRLSVSSPGLGADPLFLLQGSLRGDEDKGLTLHVDLFAGSAADGAPVLTLDLRTGDGFAFTLDAAELLRVEAAYDKAAGSLLLNVETEGFAATLSAAVAEGEGELRPCRFPNQVVALEGELTVVLEGELTGEQRSALSEELQQALAPVIAFLAPKLAEAGIL